MGGVRCGRIGLQEREAVKVLRLAFGDRYLPRLLRLCLVCWLAQHAPPPGRLSGS